MLDPRFFRFYEQDWLRLPSVTTVLQLLPEPEFVTMWRNRIGPEQFKKEMEWYGERGTIIHLMCENHFLWRNEPIPTDPKLQKFVAWFHYFINAYKHLITPVLWTYFTEWQLFSEILGYAWRFDLICCFAGKITLVDFKTSTNSKISPEQKKKHSMQLSAYVAMWNSVHPELPIEQAMVVMFTDSKKTGLGEVFLIPMEDNSVEIDLVRAWKNFRSFLIAFHLEYVPELSTQERLLLISSYEICKKV